MKNIVFIVFLTFNRIKSHIVHFFVVESIIFKFDKNGMRYSDAIKFIQIMITRIFEQMTKKIQSSLSFKDKQYLNIRNIAENDASRIDLLMLEFF